MSLDFHKPLTTTKKMRKRKELDALVSSEKLGSKYTAAAGANGVVSTNGNLRASSGGSGASGAIGRKSSRHSHQLLEESGTNSENEIQQGELSGDGEVYAQVGERRFRRRQHASSACGSCGRNCVSFLGVCSFLLAVACVVAVAALAWMQMELKRELSLFREQLRNAGESDRGVVGDLVGVKNRVEALAKAEEAEAKTLTDLEKSMTNDRKRVAEVEAGLAALKKSATSASDLANLPRELESLKKEVATVGGNVAARQEEAKATTAKIQELRAQDEAAAKKLTALTAGATAGVKEINASLAEVKGKLDRLQSSVYGDDKVGGFGRQLEATKGRVDDLVRALEEIKEKSNEGVTTEKPTSPTSHAPTTQPTPVKRKIIISAQPHEVTGVVGETTTSSSPASEVASTSTVLQKGDKLSRFESLLAANENKNHSEK